MTINEIKDILINIGYVSNYNESNKPSYCIYNEYVKNERIYFSTLKNPLNRSLLFKESIQKFYHFPYKGSDSIPIPTITIEEMILLYD